jgi:hypothetical protein
LSISVKKKIGIKETAADFSIEKCITAIQKLKTDELIILEKLNVDGKPVYEFELRDVNGNSCVMLIVENLLKLKQK